MFKCSKCNFIARDDVEFTDHVSSVHMNQQVDPRLQHAHDHVVLTTCGSIYIKGSGLHAAGKCLVSSDLAEREYNTFDEAQKLALDIGAYLDLEVHLKVFGVQPQYVKRLL